ncbi:MAG: protein-glutamate O-methyltransferase CheR [Sulfuricurvum sp.]|nr:protein-glutamate O-methyltransferase CheR [Sulfuricurvum sp.]
MSRETLISDLLARIEQETGIVLSRATDRDRIGRYMDQGGKIPEATEKLPTALITLITTNETYFEREAHHFDFLINTILPEIDQFGSTKPIRILSAPCSSGEESYSIALRLATLSKQLFRPIEIIGIDLSEQMIEKANRGEYSSRSVHALEHTVVERNFSVKNGYYQIRPFPEFTIRFLVGNVFDDALWNRLGMFDVIFSRNMMIYFDASKNSELLKRFRAHLHGYLLIGHADDHRNAKLLFSPRQIERGIVYHT